MPSMLTLPARAGGRPTTHFGMPHAQLEEGEFEVIKTIVTSVYACAIGPAPRDEAPAT